MVKSSIYFLRGKCFEMNSFCSQNTFGNLPSEFHVVTTDFTISNVIESHAHNKWVFSVATLNSESQKLPSINFLSCVVKLSKGEMAELTTSTDPESTFSYPWLDISSKHQIIEKNPHIHDNVNGAGLVMCKNGISGPHYKRMGIFGNKDINLLERNIGLKKGALFHHFLIKGFFVISVEKSWRVNTYGSKDLEGETHFLEFVYTL